MKQVKDDSAAPRRANTANKGLVCSACGCKQFRVVYLKRLHGALLRRRECRRCGKRITTRETTQQS